MPDTDLAGFAADARRRVATGYYDVTPSGLGPNGSLASAVSAASPFALVAEVKRRSPGYSPTTTPLDASDQAAAYVSAGACGVSVLTDADNFAGALDDLIAAHGAGAPTLMKDFVVDVAQLDAAASLGASAVLAIVTLHDRGLAAMTLDALVSAAHDRGLDVLAEVRTHDELATAVETDADLFGVNARNLDTLAMEPQRCADVLAAYDDDRPVLWLSGVSSRRDVERAERLGAAGALVGSHLVAADDPADAVAELLGANAP